MSGVNPDTTADIWAARDAPGLPDLVPESSENTAP